MAFQDTIEVVFMDAISDDEELTTDGFFEVRETDAVSTLQPTVSEDSEEISLSYLSVTHGDAESFLGVPISNRAVTPSPPPARPSAYVVPDVERSPRTVASLPQNATTNFVPGERVLIIGGKYTNKSGTVVKPTKVNV